MTESRIRTIAIIAILIGVLFILYRLFLKPAIEYTDESKQLKEALEDSLKVRQEREDSLLLVIAGRDSVIELSIHRIDSLRKVRGILGAYLSELAEEFRSIKKSAKKAGDEQRKLPPDQQLETFLENSK